VTVAVLVPVRGAALYLAQALDGVLSQQPSPDAVVVIDDGSTPALVLHPDHAPRCKLVRRETSGGPAAARATGLVAAGDVDLVALCDSDDVWEPGKLAAQLDALARHPEAGLCFGSARIVGVDDRATGERWEEIAEGVHHASDLAPSLYVRNPIPTSSVVVRAAALARAGGFDTTLRLAEDWDLWLRLLARGESFVSVPSARIRYRRHPGGLTADVAALAECQIALHEDHTGLVDSETAQRCRAADLVALARGRARRRDWKGARAALRAAGEVRPLTGEERALASVLAVPLARRALGRRSPYRPEVSAARESAGA
jgi:glycosyltransferase involved in cell wall biosynthesis